VLNVGFGEIIVIALVLLMAVGPEQLPGVIRRFGQVVGQFRGMTDNLRSEFMAGLDEIERATDVEAWARDGADPDSHEADSDNGDSDSGGFGGGRTPSIAANNSASPAQRANGSAVDGQTGGDQAVDGPTDGEAADDEAGVVEAVVGAVSVDDVTGDHVSGDEVPPDEDLFADLDDEQQALLDEIDDELEGRTEGSL
jgi:Tat protein translocase TatB subunit